MVHCRFSLVFVIGDIFFFFEIIVYECTLSANTSANTCTQDRFRCAKTEQITIKTITIWKPKIRRLWNEKCLCGIGRKWGFNFELTFYSKLSTDFRYRPGYHFHIVTYTPTMFVSDFIYDFCRLRVELIYSCTAMIYFFFCF